MGFFITPDYLASSKRIERMGLLTGAVVKLENILKFGPMKTSDLQSGLGAARPSDGTFAISLQHGPKFFRGDRLGEDVKGNYFICEQADSLEGPRSIILIQGI